MAEWKIGKAKQACSRCESEFVDGQPVYSLVEFDVDDRPQRIDQCAKCFDADGGRDRFFWETRFQLVPDRRRKIDFERLRALFEYWLQSGKLAQEALLYLVALLLIRKRHYRMLDLVSKDGGEFLRLRRVGKDADTTPFLVPAPLLRGPDLAPLREQLEQLLDGEFEEELPLEEEVGGA